MADDVIQNGRHLGPYLSFYQKLRFYYLNFEKKKINLCHIILVFLHPFMRFVSKYMLKHKIGDDVDLVGFRGSLLVFLSAVEEINEMLEKHCKLTTTFFCPPKRSANKYKVEG